MNVAIVGSGLIGRKRALALDPEDQLIIVADQDISSSKTLANKFSADFCSNHDKIAEMDKVETVIISVFNKYTAEIAVDMLKHGKNVLCEKPLGINQKESQLILDSEKKSGKKVKTGFNHRFHMAVRKAKEICEQNSIGVISHIRSRYGHGGRPGMETEWRCDKDKSGGGELLDQGVHIIDLCRWFIGDQVKQVYGKIFTSFWDIAVDDNAFFNLEFSNSIYAQCHVSWTNWKNVFSFEIFGSNGYIHIQGLGGSYGLETLEIGHRNKNGGKPDIQEYSFPGKDDSWSMEWQNFKQGIETDSQIIGDALDGHYANIIIEAIYRSNEKNRPVPIN